MTPVPQTWPHLMFLALLAQGPARPGGAAASQGMLAPCGMFRVYVRRRRKVPAGSRDGLTVRATD
jgi:hypothetical protein